MQDALERISRKLINAENALRVHDYICPECSAPVILRAGYERTAYFAHASGVSDEDCARYAAGFESPGTHELIGTPHNFIDTLQLHLRIKRNGGEYGWALDLAVPTHRVNSGSIIIEVGGRTSEINLDGNLLSYRTISAIPQESPYRIVEVKPSYSRLSALEKTCPALDRNFATVFGYIDRLDATGITRSTNLQPERTYAFIWAESSFPVFPEELVVKELSPRENWCGALVTIPHQVSSNCFAWLEQFTQLKFIKAAPAIVPIWPPMIRSISSLRIETLPRIPFSFFVEHVDGALAPPVFARSEQVERVTKADSLSDSFYELVPEGAKSVELVCKKGPRLNIDFQLDVTQLKSINHKAVKLIALNRDGITVHSVLHSCDASGWLFKVRSGELSFKEMTLPTGVKGQVKILRDTEWVLELELSGDRISRISPNSFTNENAELANRLIAILRDQSLSVMIDFSSLGRGLIYGTKNAIVEKKNDVPEVILRKIRQYFLQFPTALSTGSRWSKFSDSQLLSEFNKTKPTLKSLAHYRLIKKHIPK